MVRVADFAKGVLYDVLIKYTGGAAVVYKITVKGETLNQIIDTLQAGEVT